MTCKDCIHYEACEWFGFIYVEEMASDCLRFKPKSRFIELPCEVGQKVWVVFSPKFPANPKDKGKWFMIQDGVQRVILGAKGFSIETWNMGTIPANQLGIKIFTTKEEAEKALAEREKK